MDACFRSPLRPAAGALEQARTLHGAEASVDAKISQRASAMTAAKPHASPHDPAQHLGNAAAARFTGASDGSGSEAGSDSEDAPLPGEALSGSDDDSGCADANGLQQGAPEPSKRSSASTAAAKQPGVSSHEKRPRPREARAGADRDASSSEAAPGAAASPARPPAGKKRKPGGSDAGGGDAAQPPTPVPGAAQGARGTQPAAAQSDPAGAKEPPEGAHDGFYASAPSGTAFSAATFADLGLSRPLTKACAALGYEKPTPIQAACVPLALAGRDVVGSAITGAGKTAAFALPMLERLLFRSRRRAATRALVLAPARELAMQVCRSALPT